LQLQWTRRSRRGWAWLDEVDAPLGESAERYVVDVVGPRGALELYAKEPALLVGAADLAGLGGGELQVSVRQVGDWAASRPAGQSINLN
jgi:hypothetical protein